MRLLIVDDNRHCRESLARLMRAMGHQVRTLDRGEDVQDEVAHSPADLFFVDLRLPGVDGYEVARRLRKAFPRLRARVVALSVLATQADKERALAAGFDDHLAKPARVSELEALLTGMSRIHSAK